MYGAALGDMIGAPFEFERGPKSKVFDMFTNRTHWTDDTVMTVAVAEALLDAGADAGTDVIRQKVIASMQKWGRAYPNAGYGGRFGQWLWQGDTRPYGSWGNGSAMRVSAAGWLYDSLERTREVARATADVTHNHPEGIKGAESVAAVIWMARHGESKQDMRVYVERKFGYDFSRTCDQIRPGYRFNESCQGTVPQAMSAFWEGEDFEDVLRTAVSLGGDCDTLTAIAASMAEAYYGMPDALKAEAKKRLAQDMIAVLDRV